MDFSLKIADNNSQQEWDDFVQTSQYGTIFHTWNWLKIMEKNTDSILYPLEVYVGSTHIANYPVFFKNKGLIKIALSPPYYSDILYLGPVMLQFESLKQHKKEDYLNGIQSEIDKFLFSGLNCNYVNLRTAPGLYDSRYLRWAGYNIEPFYTYRIDLKNGPEYLWPNFHKTVRQSIRYAEKKGIVIEKGDLDDLRFIQSRIITRFNEQGKDKFNISGYFEELYHEYNGRNLDIFVARYDEKTVSGAVHLNYNGVMYQWVGVPKSEVDGISPNDLLVWESIRSACAKGLKYYELMDGGDNPRLRWFKSKFNPEISIWYSAEKYSHPIYRLARNVCRKTGYHIKV